MIEKPAMRSCPFCQANNKDDARVCYNCGRELPHDSESLDTAPTQPTKLTNPYGQSSYGQPAPTSQPPNYNQPSNWQPASQPPAPTPNLLPTWLLLIGGVSLLIIMACGVAFVILLFNAKNGTAGLGSQVSTQIAQAFGGAGSGNSTPVGTVPPPTPWPSFTPLPTDTLQPTVTPSVAASPTLNPTQASIANNLLSPGCKGALDQLSQVSDQVKNDPLKVLDDTWRKNMDQATADLKTNCGSLDSASPIPGEIGQVQNSMKLATSEFDLAKLLWNQAIDQRNPSKAISAAQHVGQATKYLSQAISQLQKLAP
jgi:hypothetical protein